MLDECQNHSDIVFDDPSTLLDWKELPDVISKSTSIITETETVKISEALNRIAVMSYHAPFSLPQFNRSLVDGFAIADLGKHSFKIIGEVPIGIELQITGLQKGSCLQVATGSVLPKEIVAVIPIEHTMQNDNVMTISDRRSVKRGAHIESKGSDIETHEKLIQAKSVLKPQHISALAAFGIAEIEVFVKPRILIVSTGDEVKQPGEDIKLGEVYDSTTYMISSFIHTLGGIVTNIIRTGEDKKEIVDAITSGIQDAHVILTIGGTSMGKKDHVSLAIKEIGTILFHGLNVRPGKPILMGLIDDTVHIGFPGFITSSAVMSTLLLPLLLQHLLQCEFVVSKTTEVKASKPIKGYPGWYRIVPGYLNENNEFVSSFRKSSSLSSWFYSQGYIIIPPGKEMIAEGEVVEYLSYPAITQEFT